MLLLTLSTGCVPPTPEESRAFLNLPREQRHTEFRTYAIEKQIEVYLCAMKGELPDSGLATDIADHGESVISPVMDKLKSAKSEVDQENLIQLLEVLSDRGYLHNRKDVVTEISNVIDSMKISSLRQSSLERLKKTQINNGVPAFTYTH